jgi:hypothetical protein
MGVFRSQGKVYAVCVEKRTKDSVTFDKQTIKPGRWLALLDPIGDGKTRCTTATVLFRKPTPEQETEIRFAVEHAQKKIDDCLVTV